LSIWPSCACGATSRWWPMRPTQDVGRGGQRALWPGAPYTDFARMLSEQRPDVVHVLTPPQAHHTLTMQALSAGAHVFVESRSPRLGGVRGHARSARERGCCCARTTTAASSPPSWQRWRHGARGGSGTRQRGRVLCGVMGANGRTAIATSCTSRTPAGGPCTTSSPPSLGRAGVHGRLYGAVAVRRRLDGSFASDDELRALLTAIARARWSRSPGMPPQPT